MRRVIERDNNRRIRSSRQHSVHPLALPVVLLRAREDLVRLLRVLEVRVRLLDELRVFGRDVVGTGEESS